MKHNTKKVAILQSSYIPWKGYFDIINSVDEFIWYDDVQYTKNDWRNRNKIKTVNGMQWLTVPCGGKGSHLINEVELSNKTWQKKHWASITQAYSKTPYFNKYYDFFEELYLGKKWHNLSQMNQSFIEKICKEILGITTHFINSTDYETEGRKQERLIDLLTQVGATCYLSGPAAKNYIDETAFSEQGINVEWMDYQGYPEYSQRFPPFEHAVSIIDLIANTGGNATKYMKRFT